MKRRARLFIGLGICFLGFDHSSAQTQPIELIEQACPSTESLPHPCWAIQAKTDQVVIQDVTIEGGDCVLAQRLNLPTGLKRDEALSIVTGLCRLGDVTKIGGLGDLRLEGSKKERRERRRMPAMTFLIF